MWVGLVAAVLVVVIVLLALMGVVRRFRATRGAEPRQLTGPRRVQLPVAAVLTTFALALFLTPLLTIVPLQAAAPALVAVGFLMMTQVKHIDWDKYEIAIPAFLTIAVMPFTYSITNGIGAGFLAYVVIKTVLGKAKDIHWLLWGTSALFLVYFAINPIEQVLGVK